MHLIFLSIMASMLVFIGLIVGRVIGYPIKLWQIVFLPPLITIVGIVVAALPLIVLFTCLLIIQQ